MIYRAIRLDYNQQQKEMEIKKMQNRYRSLRQIGQDKELMALFGGIVVVTVIMVSLAIAAGIWYL